MSKKASPTVVGAFVMGAVALGIAAVAIFGGGGLFRERLSFVLYFEGSVNGLQVGSPVVFRGVRIGSVRDVVLVWSANEMVFRTPVVIDIDPERIQFDRAGIRRTGWLKRLIKRGLRAKLQIQSIVTGQLMVELDMYPEKPARFVGEYRGLQEIPTIPSTLQTISATIERLPLEEIVTRSANALQRIEKVINSAEFMGSVKGLQETLNDTDLLVRNLNQRLMPAIDRAEEMLSEVKGLARTVSAQVDSAGTRVDGAIEDAQRFMRTSEAQVQSIGARAGAVAQDIQGLVRHTDAAVEDARRLAGRLEEVAATSRKTLEQARSTLATAEGWTADATGLPQQLSDALNEISSAARAVRILAEFLQRYPDALLRGKGGAGER
jgi:paraquat-inducible protein B